MYLGRSPGRRGGVFLAFTTKLEEELLALLISLSPPNPASAASKVEERDASQSGDGWTEVGKRNKMVLTGTVRHTFLCL
jgi:hypothetical protein